MTRLEQALWDKYMARALDHGGMPLTRGELIRQCERDIRFDGREAKTGIYLKGSVGMRLKSRRRLFPTGPLGNVGYGASGGRLSVEFPSMELLESLDGPMSINKLSALARHYVEKSEPRYPDDMPLALSIQMAQHITEHVDIAEDVVESVWRQQQSQWGSAHQIALHILRIEDEARKRRWKRVDLARWETAGLDWPALPIKRRSPTQVARQPLRFNCTVTVEETKLLGNYRAADESGKKLIEGTAALAAQADKRKKA